jgi:ribosomal-protein-alanine N-acetyltransferase
MSELRTERLVLRPLTMSDHVALLAHWSAPLVRRFLFDDKTPTAALVTEFVVASQKDFALAGYGLWSLWPAERESGLIGTIGLRRLVHGPTDAIEIVYSLEPEYWGRGLAVEAATAVLSHAFETVGLDRVLAEIDEGNIASAGVAARLGMRPVGTVAGELGPMTHYAVNREEWSESRREGEM